MADTAIRFAIPFVLVFTGLAHAEIRDCPGISNDDYKILLDEFNVFGQSSGDSNTQLLTARLLQKIRFDLTALQLETTPQLVSVPCNQRKPQDSSEFTSAVIDSLNGHRVLMEIWGQIETHAGSSAPQKAQLNYTVVPISFYNPSAVPPGGFAASYEKRVLADPDHLVKLFGEFNDLKAYVSLAAGVKSLKEHDYDQAYHCLCRATALLEQPSSKVPAAERSSLLNYLKSAVADTVSQARADPIRSTVKLLPQGAGAASCPSGLP